MCTAWNAVGNVSPETIICYGVGNFASRSRSASIWQLVCALCLTDYILKHEIETRHQRLDILFYDPCTTRLEESVLKELNVQLIDTNEKGRHAIRGSLTVFFMPHCPMRLYANVLSSNWKELSENKVVILGNSLVAYVDRELTRKVPECISLVSALLKEEILAPSKKDLKSMPGDFEEAFNDFYLTWFPSGIKADSWPDKPADSSGDEADGEVL
jgi:hypothetical protein